MNNRDPIIPLPPPINLMESYNKIDINVFIKMVSFPI